VFRRLIPNLPKQNPNCLSIFKWEVERVLPENFHILFKKIFWEYFCRTPSIPNFTPNQGDILKNFFEKKEKRLKT